MMPRTFYIAILLSIVSIQLKAQLLPNMTGIQSQLLMRSNFQNNNILPQGSNNTSKRSVMYSDQQKKLRDSLITNRNLSYETVDTALVTLRKKIFGFSIFNNKIGVFEPNLKIATPINYIVGPEDELIVDINGYSEEHYNLIVSPDGYVKINRIGNVYVAGLTIDQAKNKIINKLSQIFIGLKQGSSNSGPTTLSASVSLGNIRTIGVTIQGEVMFPGTYSVPSLARIMNVLYLAGGPTENGTFREIQLIRNKKLVGKLDLYDFLTSGIQRNDMILQDQDIIKVGVYKTRIEVKGKVKRPALFEVLPNENLDYVLNNFCGGFSEDAFKELVKITRYTNRDRKLIDLNSGIFNSFYPQAGDLIQVESIDKDRFDNKITVIGEVFRPGDFAVEGNESLLKIISRAGGLKEDAFLDRILVERINEDLSRTNLSVNLKEVILDNSKDIKLKREDKISIFSILDLREKYTVTIHGEINIVKKTSNSKDSDKNKSKAGIKLTTDEQSNYLQKNTGQLQGGYDNQLQDFQNDEEEEEKIDVDTEIANDLKSESTSNSLINRQVKLTLPYVENMTVEDLILKAGGLRESAATGFVEIVRRKKNIGLDSPKLINSQIAEIIKFGISKNLQLDGTASSFKLLPFDEVFIRTSPNYELQQFVTMQGQLVFPGVYGLEKKDERLSDLVSRAGGLNNQAYPQGAKLIRKNQLTESEKTRKKEQLSQIQNNFNGVSIRNDESATKITELIGINLLAAINNPGGDEDLFLNEGDIIDIPREPQTVKVTGEVLYPNSVKFNEGKSFKDFISEAGGFTANSARKRAYVLYSNGSVKRARNVLFIRYFPKIERGAEIIVPRNVKNINSAQQVFQLVSVLTGTVTSVIGIITLIKATAN
ncbi:SLBB domain-containing protein [Aquirufa sp.]|jgi:protein involved in polysaccharide export with SLBB domain|uniref:SLBB domain-containing protein n=1 Tax=Aquirufa sp. TaxID=2676249 RepID=UPI0037C15B83